MAYDSLKALIRQYIKTNGEQEITGQILQNVLVEMVNQYPITDGFATQSWVTSQLAGYLPLTGGTLRGNLTVLNSYLSVVAASSSSTPYTTTITSSAVELRMKMTSTSIDYLAMLTSDGLTFYDQNVAGTTITLSSVTSGSFIKSGGTSSEFLKADGSVDSNTYITSAALADYLPLTGGTLRGNLTVLNSYLSVVAASSSSTPYTTTITSSAVELRMRMTSTSIDYLAMLTPDGLTLYDHNDAGTTITLSSVTSGSFIKSGGTSSQFLKADGSVDSNTYVTASALSGYATQSWVTTQLGSYNPTTNFKTINNQSIIGTGNINIEGGGGGAYYDAEVAYLESTGTQWIDTGYTFSGTSKREFKVVFLSSGNYGFCYGANSNGNEVLLGTIASYLNGANFASIALNTLYEITIDCTTGAASCVINGLTKATSQGSPNNGAEHLFNYSGISNSNIKWRLYHYKIYDNNVLVRDFIPVRVGQVGYLYDKVSGQLFGNEGTGDFVLGQDTGPGGGLPYLPLTGGTITGNLTVNGFAKFNNDLTFATSKGIYFVNDYAYIRRSNNRLLIVDEAVDDIIIGDYNNSNYTSIVNDLQGGTTNSTYSSVTQKWSIQQDGTAQFKSVSQTSDLRKKTIMGDVPMNLYNVANAPLFKFTWNDEKEYSGQHIGSAAQYWQTVLPELVSIGRDTEQTLAMQYDVIALASAITVAKTVVNHEERIILLERENEALKKEIADLKSA